MNNPSQSYKHWRFSIVFWLFIIISFPLAIGVVLYASGYTLDRDTGRVVVNSALAVETTPSNAVVLIDGVEQKKKTPYIQTIRPGRYAVELHKDGFHAWMKEVDFTGGASSLFPHVHLFLETDPSPVDAPSDRDLQDAVGTPISTPLTPQQTQAFEERGWSSADRLEVVEGPLHIVVDEVHDDLYVTRSLEQPSRDIQLHGTLVAVDWLDDEHLLIATAYELHHINVATEESYVVSRRSTPITRAAWHPEGAYVLYTQESGLFALELDDRGGRQQWQLNTLPNSTRLLVDPRGREIRMESDGVWHEQQLR